MISSEMLRSWAFWRRVLLFGAGVLTLAGQMLTVTQSQAQYLAFGVAVVNLLISLTPDATVAKVTRLTVE